VVETSEEVHGEENKKSNKEAECEQGQIGDK
jgi:hypothetical protein